MLTGSTCSMIEGVNRNCELVLDWVLNCLPFWMRNTMMKGEDVKWDKLVRKY